MKRFNSDENGLTLVEMLAVIVIISIFSILLMNIFTLGVTFSEKEASKASMQQHSNYILSVWREFHEEGKCYSVVVSNDKKMIMFEQYEMDCGSNEVKKQQIIQDDRFIYEVNLLSSGSLTAINPKKMKNISIQAIIKNEKNSSKEYRIETKLSRL